MCHGNFKGVLSVVSISTGVTVSTSGGDVVIVFVLYRVLFRSLYLFISYIHRGQVKVSGSKWAVAYIYMSASVIVSVKMESGISFVI